MQLSYALNDNLAAINLGKMSFDHKLKVAHIASGDLWAGAETQLFALALALRRNPQITLHVCLLNYGELYENLRAADIAVTVIDETELGMLKIGYKLYKELLDYRPDVIHTHRIKENIIGGVVAFLLGNTPSLRTVHGAPEHQYLFSQPHKYLQRLLDQLCGRYLQNQIVAVAEDMVVALSEMFPPRKICAIENGIDCESIEALAAETMVLGFDKETAVKVCFAGRLAPVKRLDLWLQTAAALVNSSDRPLSFYLIGDGPEKERLVTLTYQLNIKSHVHFLGTQSNVPALLQQMDILLLTSDHEGLPMVILEALCVKTLVVAHGVGGINKALDYGNAGYLVYRHNPDGYAEQITRCLKEPNESKKKTEAGYALVKSAFSAQQCADQYTATYLELSSRKHRC